MNEDPEFVRLLWYVLGGARGGANRAKIIHELGQRPLNLNQLAKKLMVDYRTVMHHVNVLKRNSLIIKQGNSYGAVYFLSPRLEKAKADFEQICGKLHFPLGSRQA